MKTKGLKTLLIAISAVFFALPAFSQDEKYYGAKRQR